MLRILGSARPLCDGPSRRDFLRVGALGGIGLPTLLRATAAPASPTLRASTRFGRARRCLLLFLTGGPPQHDTFDLKPEAPDQIRGELRPIATNVPGIQIGELCPDLARQADKFCIIRSVTHTDATHTSAGYTMLTGATHPLANSPDVRLIRPSSTDHPHFGCVLAKVRPPESGIPAFTALPEVIKDANVNEFPGQGAGFLGKPYEPFRIEADAPRTGFRMPDITLPSDVTARRLADRRQLLGQLDQSIRQAESRAAFDTLDALYEQAFDLIRSPAMRRAFQLDREPETVRDAYGSHLFGQGCLLARRLLEAGVPLVTVYWHYEGPDDSPVWDTHWNNFRHLRERLMPPADRAIARLFDDLAVRGLLDETLVIVMGEFGRTPRINKDAGRDHWPHVQSILMGGAGVRGGRAFGASDRSGAYPADAPVTPADLMATILHLLGIAPEMEVHDLTGRPIRVCQGRPIEALFA